MVRRGFDWRNFLGQADAMTPDEALRNFQGALSAGYATWHRSALVACERERGFLDEAFGDWAQALWELLVERALLQSGEYLEVYRAGTDYELAPHSRVFFQEAKPTHAVTVVGRDGGRVVDVLSGNLVYPTELRFDGFMASTGTWFEERPPFDHVLLNPGAGLGTFMAHADQVQFLVARI